MDNALDERWLDSVDRLHQLRNAIRDIVVPALRSVGVVGIHDQRAARQFLAGLRSLAAQAEGQLAGTPCLLLSEEAEALEWSRASLVEAARVSPAGTESAADRYVKLSHEIRRLDEDIWQKERDYMLAMRHVAFRGPGATLATTATASGDVLFARLRESMKRLAAGALKQTTVSGLDGEDAKSYLAGRRQFAKELKRTVSRPYRVRWRSHVEEVRERKRAEEAGVPIYRTPFGAVAEMTPEQGAFYKRWTTRWRRGEAIDIAGQVGYVFAYLARKRPSHPNPVIQDVNRILASYGSHPALLETCRYLLSDCYVCQGQFQDALAALPEVRATVCKSVVGDKLLSLKRVLGVQVKARDLLLLEGPKTTATGTDLLPQILDFMDALLAGREREQRKSLLEIWATRTRAGSYDLLFSALANVCQLLS